MVVDGEGGKWEKWLVAHSACARFETMREGKDCKIAFMFFYKYDFVSADRMRERGQRGAHYQLLTKQHD